MAFIPTDLSMADIKTQEGLQLTVLRNYDTVYMECHRRKGQYLWGVIVSVILSINVYMRLIPNGLR
jgi:hypothetical protein